MHHIRLVKLFYVSVSLVQEPVQLVSLADLTDNAFLATSMDPNVLHKIYRNSVSKMIHDKHVCPWGITWLIMYRYPAISLKVIAPRTNTKLFKSYWTRILNVPGFWENGIRIHKVFVL